MNRLKKNNVKKALNTQLINIYKHMKKSHEEQNISLITRKLIDKLHYEFISPTHRLDLQIEYVY